MGSTRIWKCTFQPNMRVIWPLCAFRTNQAKSKVTSAPRLLIRPTFLWISYSTVPLKRFTLHTKPNYIGYQDSQKGERAWVVHFVWSHRFRSMYQVGEITSIRKLVFISQKSHWKTAGTQRFTDLVLANRFRDFLEQKCIIRSQFYVNIKSCVSIGTAKNFMGGGDAWSRHSLPLTKRE